MNSEVCADVSKVKLLNDRKYAVHQRSWQAYSYQDAYCMDYKLGEHKYNISRSERQKINEVHELKYSSFWGNIYRYLYESNRDLITHVQDSLIRVGLEKELDHTQFATMLVSFVQDIPYKYIDSQNCANISFNGPCVPNIPYGILSPIEFLYTLSGDCDTRTVLLYTLLKNFGYQPLILISKEYRHSMLALNIPAAGEYIEHKGRKFYFWETTSVGWEAGMIAPDMKNLNYWNIALDYEY